MKIAGALIVVVVFTTIGVIRANSLSQHARCLAEIIESLRFMSSELRSVATPLPEIFCEIAKVSRQETNNFFSMLSDSMEKIVEISFAELWLEALDEGNLSLCHNEINELKRLGLSLGRYSAEEQCVAIDVCINRLEYAYTDALKKSIEGKKLYTGLGLSMGIMFAALLI